MENEQSLRYGRRSIRLKGYDYSRQGAYFITICTYGKECVLGDIVSEAVYLSEWGKVAEKCWLEMPCHYKNILLDEFIVMPNHFHGILFILEEDDFRQLDSDAINSKCRGVQLNAPTDPYFSAISPHKNTLGVIVRTYKAAVTHCCRKAGNELFRWQRNYHDRVIRNEKELDRIRQYIINNPANWSNDEENPDACQKRVTCS